MEGETERGREGDRQSGGRKGVMGGAGNRWEDLEVMAKKNKDTEDRKKLNVW